MLKQASFKRQNLHHYSLRFITCRMPGSEADLVADMIRGLFGVSAVTVQPRPGGDGEDLGYTLYWQHRDYVRPPAYKHETRPYFGQGTQQNA